MDKFESNFLLITNTTSQGVGSWSNPGSRLRLACPEGCQDLSCSVGSFMFGPFGSRVPVWGPSLCGIASGCCESSGLESTRA